MFPSPCGEKVGINTVSEALGLPRIVSFPSPCGEKVGINAALSHTLPALLLEVVSVPLRGKGRDQRSRRLYLKHCFMKFPSPCGEKVGINGWTKLKPEVPRNSRFRPLAGKR